MRKKIVIGLVGVIILIEFVVIGYNTVLKVFYPTEYSEYVYKYSEKYDIEPAWIFAIIKAESNFKKDIVSRKRSNRINADYGRNCKGNCK